MKKFFTLSRIFALVMAAFAVLAFAVSASAAHAAETVEAVVFSWRNMGLMGPGYESAHFVSVSRASEVVQHSVEYHGGGIAQKIILYRTKDAPRLALLDALGDAAENWRFEYDMPILDGSSWRVVIHYGDSSMREFSGRGQTPPRADEIKRLVLNLAQYEIKPNLF